MNRFSNFCSRLRISSYIVFHFIPYVSIGFISWFSVGVLKISTSFSFYMLTMKCGKKHCPVEIFHWVSILEEKAQDVFSVFLDMPNVYGPINETNISGSIPLYPCPNYYFVWIPEPHFQFQRRFFLCIAEHSVVV